MSMALSQALSQGRLETPSAWHKARHGGGYMYIHTDAWLTRLSPAAARVRAHLVLGQGPARVQGPFGAGPGSGPGPGYVHKMELISVEIQTVNIKKKII